MRSSCDGKVSRDREGNRFWKHVWRGQMESYSDDLQRIDYEASWNFETMQDAMVMDDADIVFERLVNTIKEEMATKLKGRKVFAPLLSDGIRMCMKTFAPIMDFYALCANDS